MQGPGQERPGEPGEQSADSECRAHPGRGRQELAAPVRRCLEPLRAVLRPRMNGRVALRGRDDQAHRGEQEGEKDEEREREAVTRIAGEQPGDERPQCQAADVRDRGDDPGPARSDAAGAGVQVRDEGGGRGYGGAESEAGEHPRDNNAGQRSPGQEDNGRDNGDGEGGQQHRTPAIPVRHVPGEQEAHHDPQRVDRVDDRDGERRQMFLLLIETVKAARGGRERRNGQE